MTMRLLVFLFALSCGPLAASEFKSFVWKYGLVVLGRLEVPAGFQEETVNYKEGVVTTLKYADGSRIVLQRGGLYTVPMLHGSEHVVDATESLDAKSVRRGHHAGSQLVWAEQNFRKGTDPRKKPGFPLFFPPNIAYSNALASKADDFNRALDSFQF